MGTHVFVVGESPFQLRQLTAIFHAAGMKVVGTCTRSRLSSTVLSHQRLDVVVLVVGRELEAAMAAVESLMLTRPLPTVLLGAPELAADFETSALTLGVVSVVRADLWVGELREVMVLSRDLLHRVQQASRIRVVRNLVNLGPVEGGEAEPRLALAPTPPGECPAVVVVGASTGGPAVLARLLAELPHPLAALVLVVVHVPAGASRDLVVWLNQHARMPVEEARDGQLAEEGRVYVAPGDRHLVLEEGSRLGLRDSPPVHFHRPSVDVLFTSAARWVGPSLVGVILSGMGIDGAAGAVEIRSRGGFVVLQSLESCQVDGMPGAALARGAQDEVVAPEQLAAVIRREVGHRRLLRRP